MKQIHIRLSDWLWDAIVAETNEVKCSITEFIQKLATQYFKEKDSESIEPISIGLELALIRERLDKIINHVNTNPDSAVELSIDNKPIANSLAISDASHLGIDSEPIDLNLGTDEQPALKVDWDNYPEMRESIEDTEELEL